MTLFELQSHCADVDAENFHKFLCECFPSYKKVILITHGIYFFLFTELFDNYMQQDAHEFLNYLLNTIADLLQGKRIKVIIYVELSTPNYPIILHVYIIFSTMCSQ